VCGFSLHTGLRALCTLSTTLRSGAGEDEIERIRREFEDAKRNYLSIPAAIKDMPKMNPQGRQKRNFDCPSLPPVLLYRSFLHQTLNICWPWLWDRCTVSRVSGIYVNKNVKLDDLQVYGFDYDYTLSHYSEHLQCLIYNLAKKHLVNEVWFLSFFGVIASLGG
jgi:hypothetical protein